MTESLLYITFKDIVQSESGFNMSVNCIKDQLLVAADRIHNDPNAIYSYLRSDSIVSKPVVLESEMIPFNRPENPPLTEEEILSVVFKQTRKTDKSEKIVKYLVQNAGAEVTVDQLTNGASISRNDLSSWMATTGCKIPAIIRVSRGNYKFDPDRLNI